MARYKTKQKNLILEFFQKNKSKHFTAYQIKENFDENHISLGLTTIYRQLNALIDEGRVKKYVLGDSSSAFFEYIDVGEQCCESICFHMKCESCDELFHVDCDELKKADEHIMEYHKFKINPQKTVYYGVCNKCLNED